MDRFTFWMVWCPTGRSPMFKHESADSARKEAQRLAGENHNSEFYVLQAIARVKVEEPPITVTALKNLIGEAEYLIRVYDEREIPLLQIPVNSAKAALDGARPVAGEQATT